MLIVLKLNFNYFINLYINNNINHFIIININKISLESIILISGIFGNFTTLRQLTNTSIGVLFVSPKLDISGKLVKL